MCNYRRYFSAFETFLQAFDSVLSDSDIAAYLTCSVGALERKPTIEESLAAYIDIQLRRIAARELCTGECCDKNDSWAVQRLLSTSATQITPSILLHDTSKTEAVSGTVMWEFPWISSRLYRALAHSAASEIFRTVWPKSVLACHLPNPC